MPKHFVMPEWALTMNEIFRADIISQFVITGNIHDLIPFKLESALHYYTLHDFLSHVLFETFDVVLFYDRGKGITLAQGREPFSQFLEIMDRYAHTQYSDDAGTNRNPDKKLTHPGLLPRQPQYALEILDRFLRYVGRNPQKDKPPLSVAIVLEYANYLFPRGESIYLSNELGSNLITVLNWARDPAIGAATVATVLTSETLGDLNPAIVNNSYAAIIELPLPAVDEIHDYLGYLSMQETQFSRYCPIETSILATKLTGLNRIGIKSMIYRSLRNEQEITYKGIARIKKEMIEKESFDKLEFIETNRTLDQVAGHDKAKEWLRADARLLKSGVLQALPMGYLITGRIGTGKTYLVQCFAGECGVPFVQMKNFRDKWVGASEANLEKVFQILHALGQVVVFVDEADQATGKRDGGEGDSGLSGRIYAMLAKEMANTDNRGKIIWIFATSRPDLLEIDLKRQGRLDIHIPLFPPASDEDIRAMFLAIAAKLKIELTPEAIPLPAPQLVGISGNEIEGLMVRSLRDYELRKAENPTLTLAITLKENLINYRPSAHTKRLELMDLLAVKECTDSCFLSSQFVNMTGEELDRRIVLLKSEIDI